MPLTERLRENDSHRQQRDIIIKRMKERHPTPLSVVIEPPQPTSVPRRSKQWKYHFTITLTVPTFAVFACGERTPSRSQAVRPRRRYAQWKAGLPFPSRAEKDSSPNSSRHEATPVTKHKVKAYPEVQGETSHQQSQRRKPAPQVKTVAHQSPVSGKPQRRGVMCPLCRNETVESRWKGREAWLRYAGVSARRCPRCLHRFYKEPLVLRPMHKLINVRNNVEITPPSRAKRKIK